jgi:glucose-1-phosphate thymidylyltransferase
MPVMNVLILAAGYATRLYPLTLNKAKPLLEIAGKPMIERIIQQLGSVSGLGIIYVVTNAKFAAQFEEWASVLQKHSPGMRIKIINDGSTSDDDKLGAIGDINLVVTKAQLANDDLVVIAGDNLFTDPLDGFVSYTRGKDAVVAVFDVGSLEAMKKYASVTLDGDGVITKFQEKPQNPESTLAALALYYYSRNALPMIQNYLAEGNNPDQPGRFLEWLYTRKTVNTFEIKGRWLDIGSKETLEEADRMFRGA